MATSNQLPLNEYQQLGAVTSFPYTWQALTSSEVKVTLNGVLQSTGYSVTNVGAVEGGAVVFTVAPSVGTKIRIKRRTPTARDTDYQNNAAVNADSFDADLDKLTRMAQDMAVDTLVLTDGGVFDATSHRITNVANPVGNQDVATRFFVENGANTVLVLTTAQQVIATTKATEAAASAATAVAQGTLATTKAGEAAASASSASTSATSATNSSASAGNSAIAAANSAASVTGVVADATAQALAAAGSATAANASKVNAATSESNAAASAAATLILKNSASTSATTASDAATASMGYRDQAQDILDEITSGGSSGVASVNGRNGVVTLTSADVGLSNVNNTSDANKPVSTATQTALNLKINSSLIGANNGVASLDGSGLVPSSQLPSFVDDVLEAANFAALTGTGAAGKIYVTLDTNKTYRWSGSAYVEIASSPGSTDAVTEGATNKYFTDARVRAVVLTGLSLATGTAITATDTVLTSAGKLQKQITDQATTLALKAPLASPAFTGTVTGITAAMVGLSNVDNTSDANKPVSTATTTQLNLKANLASPTFTGTVSGITKAMVGLANAENTSDAAKPISTATQAALDLKLNSSAVGSVAALSYPGGTTNFLRADGTFAAPPSGGGGGGSVAWGGITGALSDQNDLQTAISAKAALAGATFTGKLILPVSTTIAPINFPGGTGVGSPTTGDLWFTGQAFFYRTDSGTSVRIARTDDPSFTGTPIAPTPTAGTNTTQIATTAFVTSAVATSAALQANLAGPTFTGIPNAPTAGAGTNTTQIATTAFVNTAMSSKANLAGAAFTGNVTISAAGSLVVTSRAVTTPSAVTYAATIAVSALLSNVFRLTLTGNVTAFSITNGTDGQTISIRIKQDATGGRTITLPSNVKALGALNTTANRVSLLTLTYCSADVVWEGGFVHVAA